MKEQWGKIRHFVVDSSLFVVVYKGFEELVARVALMAVSNIFSILFCVTFTQCVQVILKKFFKTFTNKKGVDEVQFIKNTAKIIWFNKYTIYLTISSIFAGYCAYDILPLPQWAKILISCFVLILGICSSIQIGFESLKEINVRMEKYATDNADKIKYKKEKRLKRLEAKTIRVAAKKKVKEQYKELLKEFQSKKKELTNKHTEKVLEEVSTNNSSN